MRSNIKTLLVATILALTATTAAGAPADIPMPQHPNKIQHSKTEPSKIDNIAAPPIPTETALSNQPPEKSIKAAKAGDIGQMGVIQDDKKYCIFLPPDFGGDIAANEDRAVAYCTQADIPGAPKARVLPEGFIKSAHFITDTQRNYIQITGRIDRSKFGLSAQDGGGQYDMRAPVGAVCNGYNAFVQLTEPDIEIFCIRCCMNKADCPVNKSTHGCVKVLGGDYS
ncbi:hypothetical protein B0O80DRAFT_451090 [Mortierella sp. GBAus27b]|nr:hypothetical protein BGX31_006958 [Mortierella sp. GBA43]KAI8354442.1 hypothetical protein B0O80DRAFT_451090 [Mortierella sp. GBAus27b]